MTTYRKNILDNLYLMVWQNEEAYEAWLFRDGFGKGVFLVGYPIEGSLKKFSQEVLDLVLTTPWISDSDLENLVDDCESIDDVFPTYLHLRQQLEAE